MAGALRHRGPDEFGVYRDRRAGLGHARLSIIDLAHRPAAARRTRTARSGSSSTARSSTTSSCATSSRRSAIASGRAATPKSSSTPTSSGATSAFRRFNGQWAVALWDADAIASWCSREIRSASGRSTSREHGGRLYFASEVKAIFAGGPGRSRAGSIRSGLDQVFTFWAPVAPQTVFEGIEELEPGTTRIYRRRRRAPHRAATSPAFPTDAARRLPRHARRRRGGGSRGARAGDEPAHAPRRRAGRQLPVGRARQLARSPRSACARRARSSTTFSLRFEDAEYDETTSPARDGRAPRQRSPRGAGVARRHRARLSRGHLPHRAAGAADRAGAALPAVAARARVGHQGRADRRGRRRDVRRLRPLPRGQGAALLGASAAVRARGRGCSSGSIPYLERSPVSQRAIMRQFFGQGLEHAQRAGFGHEPRWRGAAALKRLFSADAAQRASGANAGRRAARRLCRPSSRRGARSRRISTSRSTRCSPATCSRRRAIAC